MENSKDEFRKQFKEKLPKMVPDPKVNFTYVKREDWERIAHSAVKLIWRRLGITDNSLSFDKALCMDTDSILMARRTKALLNSRDEIMSRYDFGHMDWIISNTRSVFGEMQTHYRLLFAAAVWILDCLADAKTDFSKVYALLPQDRRLLDRFPDMAVNDCRFDIDLIRSVEYVLYFRNEDTPQTESSEDNSIRVLFSKTDATRKINRNAPNRQAFDKLIALIPKHKIEQAVQQYQNCHQAWMDSFFETIRPFCKETDEIAAWVKEWKQKQQVIVQEMKELTKAAKKELERKTDPTREELLSLHDGIQQKNSVVLDYSVTAPKQHIEEMEKLWKTHPNSRHMLDKFNEGFAENDELFAKLEREDELRKMRLSADFCYRSVLNYRMALSKKTISAYPQISCPQLPVTDAYGICFALLYLIEQGSDLPWLYGPSTAITEQAAMKLPWISPTFLKQVCIEKNTPDASDTPEEEETVDLPDWSERKYSVEGEEDDPDFRCNLAQISMEVSDCLPPRDLNVPRSILDKLHSYGIQDDVGNVFLHAVCGFQASAARLPAKNFDEDYIQALLLKNGAPQRIPRAELESKNAEQETEIRKLRAALRDAERQSAQNEKKLLELQEKTQIERQELYDLREYVFNLNAADDEKREAEAVNQEKQSYTVQQNTVIVGGHDSFLKALRPMLKGKVRYIDREQNFDTGMLRSADVIWIQLNALSHSQFYKVMEAARKYRKQVRMFRQASAWKCAEQVAENDT